MKLEQRERESPVITGWGSVRQAFQVEGAVSTKGLGRKGRAILSSGSWKRPG